MDTNVDKIYDIKRKNANYTTNNNNSKNLDKCYYEENNKSNTTCDKSIVNSINLIINEIIK